MTLGFQDQNFDFCYKNVLIRNSTGVLGITIDYKLNLKSHIIHIYTVANQKLIALCRTSN